jgi:hypothetical protein
MLANLFACTGVVTSVPYDFGIESITLTTGFTYTREFGVEVLTQGEVTEYCVQAETEVESQCEWLPEPIPNSLSLPATITTRGTYNLVLRVKNKRGASRSYTVPSLRYKVEQFDLASALLTPLRGSSAVKTTESRFYVIGGYVTTSNQVSNQIWQVDYDQNSEEFSAELIAAMSVGRAFASAALAPDGRIVISGGNNSVGEEISSVEIFDPTTNTIESGVSGLTARFNHSSFVINDLVHFLGGQTYNPVTSVSPVEVLNGSTINTTGAGIGRFDTAMVKIDSGLLFFYGGYQSSGVGSGLMKGFDGTNNGGSANWQVVAKHYGL